MNLLSMPSRHLAIAPAPLLLSTSTLHSIRTADTRSPPNPSYNLNGPQKKDNVYVDEAK